MRARQIMTKNVMTVTPETSILDAATMMLRCHVSGLHLRFFDTTTGLHEESPEDRKAPARS